MAQPPRPPRYPKDPVTTYGRRVLSGAVIVGPYIRLAAQRHIRDLESCHARGLIFDHKAARRAIEFFSDFLTVEVDGEVEPFHLMDWQAFCVGSLFGWKWAATGYRRFRRAYIETAKGSGKTPMLGGIGLYMLLLDGEMSAEVFCAGSVHNQSMIMFKDVMHMVDRSPRMRLFRLRKTGKNPGSQLTHVPTASFFRPVASGKSKSGPRVSCGLIDELHEHKDRYIIDMLQAGFKGRKQPLLVVATNSGFDRESICWEWHDHSCVVVEGLQDDDALFAFVMSLDEGDDPLEEVDLVEIKTLTRIDGELVTMMESVPRCWLKTNPGLGITLTVQYLCDQVKEARQIPGRESGVRRLNFCEWTDAAETWVTRAIWVANEEQGPLTDAGENVGFGDMSEGRMIPTDFMADAVNGPAECYLGLDLSFAFDLTALAFALPDGDNLAAWVEYFTPKDTAAEREKKDRVPYVKWIDQGLIHGVPGNIVRKEYVAARIAEVSGLYDVRWAAYDRYRHKELAAEMAELGVGIPWIEHPQGFRRGGQLDGRNGNPLVIGDDGKPVDNPLWMPDSIMKFETRLIDKSLRVQPSRVTRWQVSSVVIRQDPAGTGNRVFDKAKAVGRIDGIVALAMAIGAAEMRLPARDITAFLRNPVRTI